MLESMCTRRMGSPLCSSRKPTTVSLNHPWTTFTDSGILRLFQALPPSGTASQPDRRATESEFMAYLPSRNGVFTVSTVSGSPRKESKV